jgi:Tol biopolymer transport system component
MFFYCAIYALETIDPTSPDYSQIIKVWKEQDSVETNGYRAAINKIAAELPIEKAKLLRTGLNKAAVSASMEQLYFQAATERRAQLFSQYLPDSTKIVYTAHGHRDVIFLDNTNEAGGDLILLTMAGGVASPTVLVKGETRDPDVSFDGSRVLYAFRDFGAGKKSYHLYEIDIKTRSKRQITSGEVASDYRYNSDVDGIYLPNDDIMFCSTRMIQMGDCLDDGMVTANLFLCNKDGKYLRRISYDQAQICYPSVLADGRVIYCRWDYNDKNHSYAHGLFVVNPDGTKQEEYYGNNSWWPTALYYPHQIPNSNKIIAIVGGYHSGQAGIVGTVDRNLGINNGVGITLLAPVRLPKDDTLGSWGKNLSNPNPGNGMNNLNYEQYKAKWGPYAFDPAQFPKPNAYPNDFWTSGPYTWPYPFDENNMLVCQDDGLYFLTSSGQKELITSGKCVSPRIVAARQKPSVIKNSTNWSKSIGTCSVMDVNISQTPLLKDIARGTIKRLRVVGLEYRSGPTSGDAGMCLGPGCINNGGATTPIPIAFPGASWDVKRIIGETRVESDGSASFYVPPRTPVYFQALDEKGHVVQTMRSWVTLMPGETNTCMGCHESKLTATPPLTYTPIAVARGPVPLDSFYGPVRGFSFTKEIQPILNAKCVSCHNASHPKGLDLRGDLMEIPRGTEGSGSGRLATRAYLNLLKTTDWDYRGKYVWWPSAEESPLLQPPYRTGSSRSPLISQLEAGHKDVKLTSEELRKICCWIDIGIPSSGDYIENLNRPSVEAKIADRMKERANFDVWEKKNIDAYLNDNPPVKDLRPVMNQRVKIYNQLWAYPNPFTDATLLQFTVPSSLKKNDSRWSLSLHDCAGRFLGTIGEGYITGSEQTVRLNSGTGGMCKMAIGTYFCILHAAGIEQTVRIVRIK